MAPIKRHHVDDDVNTDTDATTDGGSPISPCAPVQQPTPPDEPLSPTSPTHCGAGAGSIVGATPSAAPPPRKRVCKACDRCRMKKSKCDGKYPCERCHADNVYCVYGDRKKTTDKVYPKGYVALLEDQVSKLSGGVSLMYHHLAAAAAWPGPPVRLQPSGNPYIHDVLAGLGMLDPKGSSDGDGDGDDDDDDDDDNNTHGDGDGDGNANADAESTDGSGATSIRAPAWEEDLAAAQRRLFAREQAAEQQQKRRQQKQKQHQNQNQQQRQQQQQRTSISDPLVPSTQTLSLDPMSGSSDPLEPLATSTEPFDTLAAPVDPLNTANLATANLQPSNANFSLPHQPYPNLPDVDVGSLDLFGSLSSEAAGGIPGNLSGLTAPTCAPLPRGLGGCSAFGDQLEGNGLFGGVDFDEFVIG